MRAPRRHAAASATTTLTQATASGRLAEVVAVAGDTLGQSDYRFDREDERRGLARVTPLRSCCAAAVASCQTPLWGTD